MQVTIHNDENWSIPTEDGKAIYGITNRAVDNAKICIVMVHGLTSHMNVYPMKVGANVFCHAGYDVLRFNLYGLEADARILTDCTLQTHAQDLQAVLTAKTEEYEQVFLVGHSYGGPTIMIAQPYNADAVCLWDPSFNHPKVWRTDGVAFQKRNNLQILSWGNETIMGHDMAEEGLHRYNTEECLELACSLNLPIQVIHAGKFIYTEDEICWHSNGHPKSERVLLKHVDHSFYQGTALQDVVNESLRFFDSVSAENRGDL